MLTEKNKKIIILVGILVLAIILILISFTAGKKASKDSGPNNIDNTELEIDENEGAVKSEIDLENEELALIALIEASREVAPGANLITPDNKVIDRQGIEVKTDISQKDVGAPVATKVANSAELSEEVYKIEVSKYAFSPNEFKVRANSPITISLSSNDISHNLVFDDPILKGVSLSVSGGETRAITFVAPSPGYYSFYCNVGGDRIGHASRGEVGVMIVE